MGSHNGEKYNVIPSVCSLSSHSCDYAVPSSLLKKNTGETGRWWLTGAPSVYTRKMRLVMSRCVVKGFSFSWFLPIPPTFLGFFSSLPLPPSDTVNFVDLTGNVRLLHPLHLTIFSSSRDLLLIARSSPRSLSTSSTLSTPSHILHVARLTFKRARLPGRQNLPPYLRARIQQPLTSKSH